MHISLIICGCFVFVGRALCQDATNLKDYDYDGKFGEEVKEPNPAVINSSGGRNSADCICVPYYQCQQGKIVTDGSGIINPRNKPSPATEMPLEDHFEPPFCGSFHVCCMDPQAVTQQPYVHTCGLRNYNGINSRILSPNQKAEAEFGEWPWQAAILREQTKGVFLFLCGGSLIDDRHVLTVAHCVEPHLRVQHTITVRLGEWDAQSTTEFMPHEDYTVERLIVHPRYKSNNLHNDIAILRLNKTVAFKPHIESICLPEAEDKFEGEKCVVTGWGTDAYTNGKYSSILREVNVPVIDNAKCQSLLRKTRLGRYFRLFHGFICAGGEKGVDSCKGDGGGPMVCYRPDGRYRLVGLVAWGIDCGMPNVPGVYIRVQKYLDWITNNTGHKMEDYRPHN